MRYAYIGPEDRVQIFGLEFIQGEPVEVTDPHALGKLAQMTSEFMADNGPAETVAAKPRRGRPPSVKPDAEKA